MMDGSLFASMPKKRANLRIERMLWGGGMQEWEIVFWQMKTFVKEQFQQLAILQKGLAHIFRTRSEVFCTN